MPAPMIAMVVELLSVNVISPCKDYKSFLARSENEHVLVESHGLRATKMVPVMIAAARETPGRFLRLS